NGRGAIGACLKLADAAGACARASGSRTAIGDPDVAGVVEQDCSGKLEGSRGRTIVGSAGIVVEIRQLTDTVAGTICDPNISAAIRCDRKGLEECRPCRIIVRRSGAVVRRG